MTAVVALQNRMSHEYDKEMSYISSTNNDEVTENNGSESKLDETKNEDIEMTAEPSLESMGLQPEAEEDSTTEKIVSPKASTKRKSDHKPKTLCEELLGEVSQSQQDAIDRISSKEGLIQMKKWLENATNGQQNKHLCMLLAQCWRAKIETPLLLSDTGIAKFVRDLKKHPEKDVKQTSGEVLKKWKSDVARDESNKLKAAAAAKASATRPAASAVTSKSAAPVASKSAAAAQVSSSVPSKPQTSTPVVPKIDKKKEAISRPKTARTKNTKFRKTGFEEEDEEEAQIPPPKKSASTVLSTPITKSIIPKKSPGSAVVSNSFMNALSAGSSVNAVELQKKRKKPPPVIDLPSNSPLEPVTVTTPAATAPPSSTVSESDPNGPNPSRVPAFGAKRRIHFADDKGEELVLIKYIENVLLNKTHRLSSDMKHADAESERISMKQRKTDVEMEEDEDMQIEMQNNAEDDRIWQPSAYCNPGVKEFCCELVEEENIREGSAMGLFVPQPDVPIEHSADPDNIDYAYTKFREPENIPVDFVSEEISEQEAMEVDDAPASPDTLSANLPSTVSPTVAPVSTYTSPPPVSTPSSIASAFEIIAFDVHGGGHAKTPRPPPRQLPVPFPLNLPNYSVPPPSIISPKAPPQPVPAPAEELVILADQPSKLNAPRLSNPAINVQSLLQKMSGKGKTLDDYLEKVKTTTTKAPVSNVHSSFTSAASTIVPNFSVPPPPIVHPVAASDDLQIIDNVDIHKSMPINAPQKQPQFGQQMAPPSRQQPLRPPPGSSGKVCNFFLKGSCTFGNNCYNEHPQPQQQPMDFRTSTNSRFNNRGRGAGNSRGGRFNPSINKAAFNSSSQNNSEASQEQDNFYRSRKRNDEYRGGRPRNRSRTRSPSPRRSNRRRSRSKEESPERYRRRRSRSRSRSSSPENNKEDYRRSGRRRSRTRSTSRSPIRSRSQSPDRS